jgi:hypothetical protein
MHLLQQLQELQQQNRSMRVFVLGMDSGRACTGFVNVHLGREAQVSCLNLSAEAAIRRMQSWTATRVTLAPYSSQGTNDLAHVPLQQVLDWLEPKTTRTVLPQKTIEQATIDALRPTFGSAAEQVVADARRRAPPEQLPNQFLELCRQELALLLGNSQAQKQFQNLIAQFGRS